MSDIRVWIVVANSAVVLIVVGVMWFFLPPAPVNPEGVSISPPYWACTDTYLAHHKGTAGGMLTRFGRTSEFKYDYWTCQCKQWSAHMVGEQKKLDKPCSNGWQAEQLKGWR